MSITVNMPYKMSDFKAETEIIGESLLKSGIIYLTGEVDDELSHRVCSSLLLLSSESEEREINLYINSPGGSVTAGLAIYDIMQTIPNRVRTIALGIAASMAQMLLSAGTTGYRFALPNAEILMHQPSGGLAGTVSDIKIQSNRLIRMKRRLAEIIASHANRDIEQIKNDFDRDCWFSAEEARDYGLIDEVLLGGQK
jgi:ATP-dependent Clp protease protease subunit